MADIALTGQVIASHYARPIARHATTPGPLRAAPAPTAEVVRDLEPGELFQLLDDTLGWAWGYADRDRRVGYVDSGSLR